MSTDGSHAPHRLQGSRSGPGEATQQLQDLTFVNMTDPQQSKSHESRTLVRRQVMVNFAREKRRQPKASCPGGFQPGSNTSNTISAVQELLNAAMPTPGDATMIDWSPGWGASGLDSPGRHEAPDPDQVAQAPTTGARSGLQRRKPTAQPSAARLLSSRASSASNSPGVVIAQWPVASDAHVQGLVNHCKIGSLSYSPSVFSQPNACLHIGHSPLFRACHPLYMTSLLANRPSAENYPFSIDIDSAEDLNQDYGAKDAVQNQFYRLAESSSMLTHAFLMVSASHLAALGNENATRQAIGHKSKALELLNEATKGLPAQNYLETLATVAILASYEVRRLPKISMTTTNGELIVT
jgi:hypothetical protein